MNIAVFGLAISSSWGNGHATIWRGLCRAFARRNHHVTFFERDVPYYARHRDLDALPDGQLVLYQSWPEIRGLAAQTVRTCDVAIVTSYCPDALPASELVWEHAPVRAFYDLDTGVTLTAWERGHHVPYIGARGLADFDVVFSYVGGSALDRLRTELGARRVAPLYGSADPDQHAPAEAHERYRNDLSYIATHADDRHQRVLDLFVEPARSQPERRFLLAGPQYPLDFPWLDNIHYIEHVPPALHPVFYASSRFTLSLTRDSMARYGYCPSGRLFEAAAVGTPILTDSWAGLDHFFEPGTELITVSSTHDVLTALRLNDEQRRDMARRARARLLSAHTPEHRVQDFERTLQSIGSEPEDAHVGHHTSRGVGHQDPAPRLFEGAAASRQPD